MTGRMHADEVAVDDALVGHLVADQLPRWAQLPIERVASTGTDYAVFLVARLLLRVTERIAAKLGEVRVRPLAVGAFARWSVVEAVLRAWLLPAAHSGRGPPAVPSGTAFA